MLYKDQVDKTRIPAHIAIIMDGNGRWAKQRGLVRSLGHQAGAETVHVIAEEASNLGVKYLTLYTFSTENWNRPDNEVNALMKLLRDYLKTCSSINESSDRFYRRRNLYEKQYQFPYYWRN